MGRGDRFGDEEKDVLADNLFLQVDERYLIKRSSRLVELLFTDNFLFSLIIILAAIILFIQSHQAPPQSISRFSFNLYRRQ